MVTPKLFKDNLNNSIITDEMLGAAIFSVNKRAKNARDKEREYRNLYRGNRYYLDYYGNEDQAKERKEYYYNLKDELLTYAPDKCVCIHRIGRERSQRKRIYDYQPEYSKVDRTDVVWSNCYYDKEMEDTVYFVDVVTDVHIEYEYFLLYKIGQYSFHHPVNKERLPELLEAGKEIIEIESLNTSGEDIANLLSVNFVKRVLSVLKKNASKAV